MTLGQLKFRLSKQFPGLDPDVLDGFISDRYGEIIQELPWTRLQVTSILQTTAPYTAGTVAINNGDALVTLSGVGAIWDSGMTGRGFRIPGDDPFYEFTFLSATTGMLDRDYEGASATAASYTLFQNVYPMPANCRILSDDAFSNNTFGPFTRLLAGQLDASDPSRSVNGQPQAWTSYMDDASTPPRMQVEVWPVPDKVYSIPYQYTAEQTIPGQSSVAFQPWMEPATALVEGVTAKILRTPQFRNLAGAQLAAKEADGALSTMRNNEAQRQPSTLMQLPDYLTSHRRKRWNC